MKTIHNAGLGHWPGRTAAVIFLVMMMSLFGTTWAKAQIYASKGFLFDPGGAPSQMTQPYFVGAIKSGNNYPNTYFLTGIWDNYGNLKFQNQTSVLDPDNTAFNPDFTIGSAVYFNNLIYVFVPYIKNPVNPPFYWRNTLHVTVIDPATWQVKDSFDAATTGSDVSNGQGKNGVGAVVANGSIYVFMAAPNSQTQVVTSSDGQNWSILSTANTPPSPYTVVQDAVTFTDPTDGGKTKVFVILGWQPFNYGYPASFSVSIFDPVAGSWGPVTTLPQGQLPDTYAMAASAWVGSWNTVFSRSQAGPCNTYHWNSGNTNAYLHVLGTAWIGGPQGATYLVHWYLDPATGSWVFDPSGCANEYQAMWWSGPCSGRTNATPVPLGPGYAKTTASGCTSGDDCLQQQMWGLSCGFQWQGEPVWSGHVSDVWVPAAVWQGKGTAQPGPWTYNTVDTSNPGDPAFGNDPNVYQAMAGMIRINGMVMGPPPFPADPAWQGPADWAQTSNVQLGQSSGTTSGTTSSFSSSITAGVTGTMTVPFVQGKEGLSFSYGYTSTHSTENSFTSNYTWLLGTQDQSRNTLGKQGWMVGHAPIIWPASYVATSVFDPGPAGTYMGYSQMILSVGDAESLFWPYSLTNPSDTSYPMGFLLTGVKPMPASTDVDGWNINQGGAMEDWSDTSSGNWSVIGGKSGIGKFTINELNMGSFQTQQFVQSQTKGKDWSDSYTGQYSSSLRLGTKGNNVTTSLDLSFGYNTEGSSSTTFQQNMETSYLVPSFQGGYSEVYVQPYLLQAETYNAPWVPKGYKGPLPWAVTWDVTYVAKPSSALGGPATVYARTTMPEKAYGRVTGTAGPNDPKAPAPTLVVTKTRDDSYAIKKGQLSYIGPDKFLIPIAMTASDFSPSKGIIITINDYKLYATSAKGTWKRSGTAKNPGDVWTYTSRYGTERLNVTLDFGARTWDMAVSRVELGEAFAGVKETALITLDLNGRFVLSTRIVHNIAYEWEADLSSFTQAMEVDTITVKKDFSDKGAVTVKGRLTDQVRAIGDASIVLNDSRKDYKLMNMPHFMEKVQKKQSISYKDETGTLAANLKTGQWTMTADTNIFAHPRPMYHGEAELKVKIGGKDYFSAYVHPESYAVHLDYELLK